MSPVAPAAQFLLTAPTMQRTSPPLKLALVTLMLALPSLASAQSAPASQPVPQELQNKPEFGIGYKVGNGVGFTGIDLIFSPVSHLSFELQASWLTGFDSGYAILPAVQAELWTSGSTPYCKVGGLYVHATLDGATASGRGAFGNIGYEWKWDSGVGIQLGGGVGYIQEVTAMSASGQSATVGGEVMPNLELGLRYRFR